jgi:hypothetical protein
MTRERNCHPEERQPPLSSRKASASRALLESAATSRRIPDCRFLTPLRKVRNDTGEELSSRKASASRALLESVTTSRRIPDCRFLTPLRKVRNDTGEELSSRGAPISNVIPRSVSLPCHPEERQRRGICSGEHRREEGLNRKKPSKGSSQNFDGALARNGNSLDSYRHFL